MTDDIDHDGAEGVAPLSIADALDGFGFDLEAVDEGRWFTYQQGLEFKLVSIENERYQAEQQKLQRPHLAILSGRDTEAKIVIRRRLNAHAVARAGVVGMRRNGVDVDFDPKDLANRLQDRRLAGMFAWIIGRMSDEAAFEAQQEADDLGN